jgi:hypothetical protein
MRPPASMTTLTAMTFRVDVLQSKNVARGPMIMAEEIERPSTNA